MGGLCTHRAWVCGTLWLLASVSAFGSGVSAEIAEAAEKQDFARVGELIEGRADVNAVQADGMSALHWAAYFDDVNAARLLVAAGANVRAANRYEVTPLSLACQNGSEAMVELLLQAGADPNARLPGGETVLMTAARTGRPGAVKALLARRPDVNARERRGQTAIMWAAAEGHAGVVRLLLQAGADVRTRLLESGFTAWFFAVRDGRAEVVRELLKAGIDVNEAMEPRKSTLKGPRRGMSALLLAVENGHFELAAELLEAGADPNDQRSGFTPLHALSWVRKPARGEDDGDPAPLGSGKLNSLQLVRKLVAHGADVNARLTVGKGGAGLYTRVGATPFLMAAATADVEYLRLLVELGADPRMTNAEGCNPLMVACGIGVGSAAANETAGEEPEVLETVKFCLELGVDINAVDANGETAMHGAAYKNLPRVIRLLSERGAKSEVWNRKNKYGWTPLMIAEGHRPGNFKPSAETAAAIEAVMFGAGIKPTMERGAKPVAPQEYRP